MIERAALVGKKLGRRSVLFIDEIHRFNKSQQDALLHSVEDGTLTLIGAVQEGVLLHSVEDGTLTLSGATTENPSFEVIPPLLSRCRVFTLEPLTGEDLGRILDAVLADPGLLGGKGISLDGDARKMLMMLASGDARQMLNGLEAAVILVSPGKAGTRVISESAVREAFQSGFRLYDKSGEEHYNVISAFIKSVRGSDPDAAIYWLARMIDGGEDPKFIARRMVVLASEDIGNADPAALPLAVACFTAVDSVGMPEARIVMAQTAAYLSACPKSNSAIMAIDAALADVRTLPAEVVPLHLRNAPTGLMKGIGYGAGYLYPHDSPGSYVFQHYLPAGLRGKRYYEPSRNGREAEISDHLASLREKRDT